MTICERCGAAREAIDEACRECRFQPRSVRELAIAALLTDRFEAGEEGFGTPSKQLALIAQEIRAGNPPALDMAEISRHEQAVEAFIQTTPMDVAYALFRFFLPGVLIIGALCALIAALRFFHP